MPRSLPWANHLTALGERPVFFAELELAHQTWSLGLYDLLPGPVQGKVIGFNPLRYQYRGGNDRLALKLDNSKFSSLGKALRCQGKANSGLTQFDGNSAILTPTSGNPFDISADHAVMIPFKVWQLNGDDKDPRYLAFRGGHFRITIDGVGTIKLQVKNGASWPTVYTDTNGVKAGELCAVGFSYDQGTGTIRYMRRSDSGDEFGNGAATISSSPPSTRQLILNGDTGGTVAGGGSDGLYLNWVDYDDFRFWRRQLTDTEFKAMARRTLKPSEAADASLSAWARFDEGTGSGFAISCNTGGALTGSMNVDATSGLFTTPSNPAWISGILRDRITDHIEAAYPLEGATIRVKISFTDPVTNSPATLFVGRVFQVGNASEMELELEVVDVAFYADKTIGRLINKTDFPNAPDESVGEMIPMVFGAVPDVPGVRTEGAQKTRLAASILTSSTTIAVQSTDGFPSSGGIRIDDETISYTGITATEFTGCTRGSVSTVATSHVTGAQVVESANEQFLFADGNATVTNIRKVNSKGEAYPLDASEILLAFSTVNGSGITTYLALKVEVRGEGSQWVSVDHEDASAYDNSLDASKACALHADWDEVNWATINAANPLLSVERLTNFDGPGLVSGVLKSFTVIEHHQVNTLTAGKRVEVRLEVGGVPVITLGDLTVQTNTPDRALQQGRFHSNSEGFEGAHQHTIPGSIHTHDIGAASKSVVFRPQGSDVGWARGLGGSGTPATAPLILPLGAPYNSGGPFFTITKFYEETILDGAADNDADTHQKFPSLTTQLVGGLFGSTLGFVRLTFTGLSSTNRIIKQARIVSILGGNGLNRELNFVFKGDVRATTGPLVIFGAGLASRTTVTSGYVDLTATPVRVSDLLRPDSYIEVKDLPGAVSGIDIYEVYLECELDETAESTRVVRPRYDNWDKALDRLRDARVDTFEPHVYPCVPSGVEYSGTTPVAFRQWYINPNPPINGPDLPFNNQVKPSLKFYFTDLDEPFARLKELAIYIAHNNCHDEGPHEFAVPSGVQRMPSPAPIVGSAPAIWNPNLAPDFVGPRYLVKVYIKGQHIAALDFSLDMTDAAERVYYDSAVAPTGKRLGAWSYPSPMNGMGYIPYPLPISSRVESGSGWLNLIGQKTGGGDFTINDLIDSTSYIEITLPNPSLSTWVDQISPQHVNPGSDPNYTQQFSPYPHERPAHGPKFFDIRIEYVSEEIEVQAAPTDVGNTDGQSALSHSSLTWFDTTALFLAVGSWTALTGVETVCEAIGFSASDAVRILRAYGTVEFGVVGEETTDQLIADVDAGDGGNPIDHVERIFDDEIGSAYKDTTAFSAASALARTDAAGAVLSQVKALDLVRSILRQYSFSGHWENGLFVPLFKPALSSLGAPSTTLTKSDVQRRSVSMRRTSIEDVLNYVEVLYDKVLRTGDWANQVKRESTPSQTAYGVTRSEVEEADWIWTQAAAEAFGDNLLDYYDHVAAIVSLTTFLNGLDFVRGDIIGLTHALVTTAALEVFELSINPGGGDRAPSISFQAIDRANRPT